VTCSRLALVGGAALSSGKDSDINPCKHPGGMSDTPYVDPIEHAWRHCNPHVPLPPALIQRAPLSSFALRRHSPEGNPLAEWPDTARETYGGPLSLAALPQITPPVGE
jgi:hypothetical protein